MNLLRESVTRSSISVILPVFNGEETIENAILSLGSLKSVNAELIVVNDGSTDATAEKVQSIQNRFPEENIQLISTPHLGVIDASNTAIEQASGEWITRIDADDWSSPHRLKLQVNHAVQHGLDIVSCLVKIVTPDGHPSDTLQDYESWLNACVAPDDILASRFIELPIPNPTVMARKEVFQMGYRHGKFPEDYDLWLRAMAAGYKPGKVPRTLYWWADHPNRVTRNHSIYTKAAFFNAKKMHITNGPLNGVTQCDFWGAGIEGKPWIRWILDQGITIRNIIEVNPKKLGQKIHGAKVIKPENISTSPQLPLFIGVGVPEGRAQIADFIHGHLPHTCGQDAWFLA